MSNAEKKIAENLAKACELLPEGKKEFLLGYAEGVAAMAAKEEEKAAEAGQEPAAAEDGEEAEDEKK